jgi:hypothetical protein
MRQLYLALLNLPAKQELLSGAMGRKRARMASLMGGSAEILPRYQENTMLASATDGRSSYGKDLWFVYPGRCARLLLTSSRVATYF